MAQVEKAQGVGSGWGGVPVLFKGQVTTLQNIYALGDTQCGKERSIYKVRGGMSLRLKTNQRGALFPIYFRYSVALELHDKMLQHINWPITSNTWRNDKLSD